MQPSKEPTSWIATHYSSVIWSRFLLWLSPLLGLWQYYLQIQTVLSSQNYLTMGLTCQLAICPSFTSPFCPCCPLAPQALPWLLCACWIWWQWHILCDSFPPAAKGFSSVGILMHYPLIFSSQFSTLMEMLDGGEQIKVWAIATFSASWSNNCWSTLQGTEYLQPVLYMTPYFQSPRKIRA